MCGCTGGRATSKSVHDGPAASWPPPAPRSRRTQRPPSAAAAPPLPGQETAIFWLLSALCTHTKTPRKTDLLRKTLRLLKPFCPGQARTVQRAPGSIVPDAERRVDVPLHRERDRRDAVAERGLRRRRRPRHDLRDGPPVYLVRIITNIIYRGD